MLCFIHTILRSQRKEKTRNKQTTEGRSLLSLSPGCAGDWRCSTVSETLLSEHQAGVSTHSATSPTRKRRHTTRINKVSEIYVSSPTRHSAVYGNLWEWSCSVKKPAEWNLKRPQSFPLLEPDRTQINHDKLLSLYYKIIQPISRHCTRQYC